MITGVLSGVVGGGGIISVVTFTTQPVVNPTSAAAGQTFTATPGTLSNGSITSREWRLAGNVVSTALTYVSTAAGALTYQEFAGSVASNLISVTVTAAAAALTTLPQQSARAAHFDASTITGLADGAAISTWTDKVASIAATGTTTLRPTYKTGVAGGLPSVRCNGTNRLTIGRPAALTTPMSNPRNWSVVIIYKNAAAPTGDWGVMMGDSYNNDFMGATAGDVQNNNLRKNYPTATQVNTFAYSGDAGFDAGRLLLNGTMYAGAVASTLSASDPICLCAPSSDGFGFTGDILEVIFYNIGLSAPEMLQAHQYACAKYGQALPHAGMARFPVFEGDSQTDGIGATPNTAYPIQVAAAKSWPLGAFANVGKPSTAVASGSNSGNNMASFAARDVDGYKAVTGLPITLIWFEYYNRGVAGGTSGDGTNFYNEDATYNAARRSADSSLLIVHGTSLSSYNKEGTARDAYNSQLVSGKAGADVIVSLHTNANVGVNGAAGTTTAGNAKFADGIHCTASGYGDVAALIGAAL